MRNVDDFNSKDNSNGGVSASLWNTLHTEISIKESYEGTDIISTKYF